MMNKLIKNINLIQRYKQLTTDKDKKNFILMWCTIFVCILTFAFVYICGIYISKKSLSQVNIYKYNSMNQESINQSVNSYIQSIISNNAINEQQKKKSSTNKVKINQTNKLTDKNNGKIKTIYMGARTTSHVAITFDDGYNKKYVEKVLDVLKENNIKSTFFIIGKVLDDYPEVWRRAIKEGHQICNHTQSHTNLTNLPDDIIQDEILGWEASARKVLGDDYLKRMKKEFPFLRLPGGGGAKSDRILEIAQMNGYKVIGWNIETVSSVINPLKNKKSVNEISSRIEQHIISKCSAGSIILLHFNKYDMGNLEQVVEGLKNRGFKMQTISQLIK